MTHHPQYVIMRCLTANLTFTQPSTQLPRHIFFYSNWKKIIISRKLRQNYSESVNLLRINETLRNEKYLYSWWVIRCKCNFVTLTIWFHFCCLFIWIWTMNFHHVPFSQSVSRVSLTILCTTLSALTM